MKTTVVNVRNTRNYDAYVGRGLPPNPRASAPNLGNPFIIGQHGDRQEVMRLYKLFFKHKIIHDAEFKERIEALRGKVIGCWCDPLECHGHVIANYLNHGSIPSE